MNTHPALEERVAELDVRLAAIEAYQSPPLRQLTARRAAVRLASGLLTALLVMIIAFLSMRLGYNRAMDYRADPTPLDQYEGILVRDSLSVTQDLSVIDLLELPTMRKG